MTTSSQADYLGIYVLSATCRYLFRAVNFFIAGGCTLSHSLFGPSVAMYYTSAYHSLHAFLALQGRVLFDPAPWEARDVEGRVSIHTDASRHPQAIMAILTARNLWQFEPRNRSHTQRWKELEQVFTSPKASIPLYYQHFFEHLYRGRMRRPDVSLLEYLRDPASHSVTLRDVLPDFLNEIAEIRHMALYEGLGVNPGVYDAMANRDHCISRTDFGDRARALGRFAYSGCEDVATQTLELFSTLPSTPELHARVRLRIAYPWIDEPQIDSLSEGALKEALKRIQEWLHTVTPHSAV